MMKAQDPWADCRNLLEWALGSFEMREVAKKGQPLGRVEVHDGEARDVAVAAGASLRTLVRRGGARPVARLNAGVIRAPVRAGERVGTVEVLDGASVCDKVALVTCEEVGLSAWGQLKHLALPNVLGQGILFLAAGVLLLGTAAKATGTRRSVFQARRREAHPRGARGGERAGRVRVGDQGRRRDVRDRG